MMTAHITAESKREFSALCDRISKVADRDLGVQFEIGLRMLVGKLLNDTPIAPKTRIAHHFVYKDKAGVTHFFPSEPYRYKPFGRGWAKAGWLKAAKGLRATVRSELTAGGDSWVGAGFFRDYRKRKEPAIVFGNTVPYIETLNNKGGSGGKAHFAQESMNRTLRHLRRTLEHHIQSDAQRAINLL